MSFDLNSLQDDFRKGKKLRFVFFWKPEQAGAVGPGCFSQWQSAPFTVDGARYVSAEQYMMAEKARLFDDAEARRAILAVSSPARIKLLGRETRGFDQNEWERHRERIVLQGNMAKFRQNGALRVFLLHTGDKVLAEASPKDRIWGIGLAEEDKTAHNPLLWKGKNLLGFILMRVRAELRLDI